MKQVQKQQSEQVNSSEQTPEKRQEKPFKELSRDMKIKTLKERGWLDESNSFTGLILPR